ncbi:MAG: oxidoreductase [marine bacterium B5-7]|nr:MAG: oxidoreductase [marine bacterium B5-7]
MRRFKISLPAVILSLLLPIFLSGVAYSDVEVLQVSPMELTKADVRQLNSNPAILSISGNIQSEQKILRLDNETIRKMGLSSYMVRDPWLESRVTYTGVLLSHLLELTASEDYSSVLAIASDGYRYEIPATEIQRWPVLLAIENTPGEFGDKGPLRIIFPYDDHTDITMARNMSVWSVAELVVQ